MAAGKRREWLTSMTMWAWPPWHTLEALEVVFVDERLGWEHCDPRFWGVIDPYHLPRSTEPGARFVLTLLLPMKYLGLMSTLIGRTLKFPRAPKRTLMKVRDELDDTLVEAQLIAKLIETERRFAPLLKQLL